MCGRRRCENWTSLFLQLQSATFETNPARRLKYIIELRYNIKKNMYLSFLRQK